MDQVENVQKIKHYGYLQSVWLCQLENYPWCLLKNGSPGKENFLVK